MIENIWKVIYGCIVFIIKFFLLDGMEVWFCLDVIYVLLLSFVDKVVVNILSMYF